MFTQYAQIENGQIVAYPVNPRVLNPRTGEYNVFVYWLGGELDGKTYVFCHNREPMYDPHTQNLVEGQPMFLEDEGIWIRTHSVVEASNEEKTARYALAIIAAENTVESFMHELETLRPEIALLDAATKEKWAEYEQNLLAVGNQTGYPLSIDWPIRPDFIEPTKISVERI